MTDLSDRELELAMLVACGRTNEQISKITGLAYGTVGNYLLSIYKRLGFSAKGSPRALLAAWFMEYKQQKGASSMKPVSESNERVLDFIRDYWRRNYCSPTLREIMSALEMQSTAAVRHHIVRLRALGLLRNDIPQDRSRALVPHDLMIDFGSAENE